MYIPKFHDEKKEVILLDDIFETMPCIDYAIRHNMSVVFINTTSTSSVEVMMAFQKEGFAHELYEEKIMQGTLELEPCILCKFTPQEKRACKYCSGDDIYFFDDGVSNASIDSKGELFISAHDYTVRCNVKYCPICGRLLI